MFGRGVIFALAIALTCAVSCRSRVDVDAVAAAIAGTLGAPGRSTTDPFVDTALRAFYQAREHQPAWTDRSTSQRVIAALKATDGHGLSAADYDVAALQIQLDSTQPSRRDSPTTTPEGIARVDLALTQALLHAGRDAANGRVPPSTAGARWAPRLSPEELAGRLEETLNDGGPAGWFDQLAPSHAGYARLQKALAAARASTPNDPRIEVMALNLDRWRWLPNDLGERHLWVNIPEFTLRASDKDRRALEMRVVVGGPGDRQTPLFSDVMQTVVFNPYWNIPDSIATSETLPAVLKDPEYLERNGIEVIDANSGHRHVDPSDVDWTDEDEVRTLAFRQRPSDANALGQVKFLFPNRHAVYMHDTPGRSLFAREKRALSHGCVRVADPVSLAVYVLKGVGSWTPEAVTQAMGGDQEQHVKLGQPLAVHLVYFTADVDESGTLRRFDDVYQLDRRHLEAVRARIPPSRKSAQSAR